jgi:hypothetical protein
MFTYWIPQQCWVHIKLGNCRCDNKKHSGTMLLLLGMTTNHENKLWCNVKNTDICTAIKEDFQFSIKDLLA